MVDRLEGTEQPNGQACGPGEDRLKERKKGEKSFRIRMRYSLLSSFNWETVHWNSKGEIIYGDIAEFRSKRSGRRSERGHTIKITLTSKD